MKRMIVGLALLAALASSAWAAASRAVMDKEIDRAIAEAKRFLWAQQRADGQWGQWRHSLNEAKNTAIATFALLEAGESINDERMKKALVALAAAKTRNLYTISMRVMALSRAGAGPKSSPYHKQLQADIKYLTAQATRQGGAWGYHGPERTGDNSCSQFALLALWEADRAEVKINPAIVRLAEKAWRRRQQLDGGWTYAGQAGVDAKSTTSMTTAGIASLYICQDVLTKTCKPYAHRRAVDIGWKYLNATLGRDYHKNGYLAFCVQRVGS